MKKLSKTEYNNRYYKTRNYFNSHDRYLWNVYGTFSPAKRRAYERCESDRESHGGYEPSICSHNTHFFSYAYCYDVTYPETGEILQIRLRYHTAYKVEDFPIWDNENGWLYVKP